MQFWANGATDLPAAYNASSLWVRGAVHVSVELTIGAKSLRASDQATGVGFGSPVTLAELESSTRGMLWAWVPPPLAGLSR